MRISELELGGTRVRAIRALGFNVRKLRGLPLPFPAGSQNFGLLV